MFKYQSVMFNVRILNVLFAIKSLNEHLMISYSMKCYRLNKPNITKSSSFSNEKDQFNTKNETESVHKHYIDKQ